MNFKKIIVCLAGGLIFCIGLRADDLAMNNTPNPLADNPYAPIVARNVFGLNPPPPPDTNAEPAGLPKITPNGIMEVFGKFQVLFKVTPTGKQGGKEEYYTLSAGERQDEIEVMSIDNDNDIVTFKNHGTVQELPLAEPSSSSGGGASQMQENRPGFNPSNGGNGGPGSRFIRFGNRGGGPGARRGGNNNQDSNGAADGSGNDSLNLRTIPTRTYQPPASNLTPEETVLQIEENRAKLMDTPADQRPYSPNLLPPTPLTGKY